MNIKPTGQFRKDFKKRIADTLLEPELEALITLLIAGDPLPEKFRDHPLKNDPFGHRDCHLRPDMVLIYRRSSSLLRLVRIGTHSDLFG
jgi:mRNA interferase YafQ